MAGSVLRWGRSAYETDHALARERAGAEALGMAWRHAPDPTPPRDLGADVLVVTSGVRVDAAVVARFSGRLVLTTTSGFDHVDVDACLARGLEVARLPEARRDAVVEHAVGSLIRLLRRLDPLEARAVDGAWARGELPELAPRSLDESRVAVIGLGVIGSRAAEVLRSLGATVLGVDPAVPDTLPLEEALARAHAVTLHCSLTPSSRGLLSAARLDLLPPGAVVVNTARGEVLDLEAAVERVRTGRLGGLAVDVFPVEPYPRLADGARVPGVHLTPHASGYTIRLGEKVADGVVRALSAFVSGAPVPYRL